MPSSLEFKILKVSKFSSIFCMYSMNMCNKINYACKMKRKIKYFVASMNLNRKLWHTSASGYGLSKGNWDMAHLCGLLIAKKQSCVTILFQRCDYQKMFILCSVSCWWQSQSQHKLREYSREEFHKRSVFDIV